MFRNLEANEIECRVAQISEKGLSLLLYKDARCDMNILDETVGAMNWDRTHKELKGNMYCGVTIRKDNKEATKWDAGEESFTAKIKGEASDSFKRACVNWGIGRELYTAPFIWVGKDTINIQKNNKGKFVTYDDPIVYHIKTVNGIIKELGIKNKKGQPIYKYGGNN